MKNQKNNKGLLALLIIFIILTLALGGYIIYDKVFSTKESSKPKCIIKEPSEQNNPIIENNKENNEENPKGNDNSEEKVLLKDATTINKMEALFGLVGAYNASDSNMASNKKYFCSGYSEKCSDIIYQKSSVKGSDLSLKFMIYNTMNYLKTYQKDSLSYSKIDYSYLDYIEISDNKFYYIKADELIDIINKFYNVNISKSSYQAIDSIAGIYDVDAQGLYLGKVNNEDVFFIYMFEDRSIEEYPHSNSQYEKKDNYIYLYTDAIYNLKTEYSEFEDKVVSIANIDGTNKIDVNENLSNISYEKYKKYYTTYMITFKENTDGTYTFISSQPIN